MASKFQNRLVGTVILVALGVIILPGLLDGKKKHYEDDFAAIPLVPKPGDVEENGVLPPVTQPLPAQPPEGAGALVEQQAANEAATQQAVQQGAQQPAKVAPLPVQQLMPKPVETRPAEMKPAVKPAPKPGPTPVQKPANEKAPAGQAYVVQLAVLTNAARANEMVASLRLSGYRAFTVPSTPVQGQSTHIYVGPDASKQKLQSWLPELHSIFKLDGLVVPYNAH